LDFQNSYRPVFAKKEKFKKLFIYLGLFLNLFLNYAVEIGKI